MPEVQDGIAVITLDHPPVNSLSHALRSHIVQRINAAEVDPSIRGIVLVGSDKAFSAGADVNELGTPKQLAEPILRTVIACVEHSSKPVVAALSGVALGGGLELALACHGRVALKSARLGLPEITLGLIPGSGGTQRLPRLAGLDTAMTMILNGQPLTASQLADFGLLDMVVPQDVRAAAIGMASQLAQRGAPFPTARSRFLDAVVVQAAVAAQRDKLTPRQKLQPAYTAALDAVEAAMLPLDDGLRRERELFLDLISSVPAQALRYQFKAEREAGKLPTPLQVAVRPVRTVAVVGAGTMGTGIAISVLDAGLDVVLIEQDEAALARGRNRVVDYYRSRVFAGKLNPVDAAEKEGRLLTTTDWPELAVADVVIEAVFEELAVKQQVFRKIDAHARAGAVLATNTSYLDVDAIARSTERPQDVLGLHFFSPAHVMKLVEVVRGAQTGTDVLATGMHLASALGKLPVLCGNAFGFIGNRIYNAYRKQCEFMLEDGAWPEDVDSALVSMGFAMGPFAVADMSGLDIAWRMRKAQATTRDARERYVTILDQLCELGRLGRKANAGYYNYVNGKQAQSSDPKVRAIIEQASARRGVARRSLTAAEIQRRALLAIVNEAALLLAEGVATRASDIDVVLVQGYGFPRWEGGPVFWARQQDRTTLETELQTLASEAGYGFQKADLSPVMLSPNT
jgi:3-hydroxyacyl-CoA dehydrogenase